MLPPDLVSLSVISINVRKFNNRIEQATSAHTYTRMKNVTLPIYVGRILSKKAWTFLLDVQSTDTDDKSKGNFREYPNESLEYMQVADKYCIVNNINNSVMVVS